jgi:hypothetical protein
MNPGDVATPAPPVTIYETSVCANCGWVITRWAHKSGLDGKWLHERNRSEYCEASRD